MHLARLEPVTWGSVGRLSLRVAASSSTGAPRELDRQVGQQVGGRRPRRTAGRRAVSSTGCRGREPGDRRRRPRRRSAAGRGRWTAVASGGTSSTSPSSGSRRRPGRQVSTPSRLSERARRAARGAPAAGPRGTAGGTATARPGRQRWRARGRRWRPRQVGGRLRAAGSCRCPAPRRRRTRHGASGRGRRPRPRSRAASSSSRPTSTERRLGRHASRSGASGRSPAQHLRGGARWVSGSGSVPELLGEPCRPARRTPRGRRRRVRPRVSAVMRSRWARSS